MGSVRSRSMVLIVTAACLAALVVALLVGSASQAEDPASQSFEAPPSTSEVVALRTENSRTYRAADGNMVARISQQRVNFRDAGGKWQPIDTALRPDGAGGLQTTAAATEVSLPESLDVPAKVTDGPRWVSFALAGADAGAQRAVSDSTATYAGALDGVDARYDAQPSGVKETLTLADASAPSTYRFALDASPGLTPSLRDDGSVVFREGGGEPRFWLPAPTVQDANAAAPTGNHVAYRLSDDHRTLTVAVDADWLAQAAFPVKVDPSIYTGTNNSCTLANGSLAATADCNGTSLKVGHDASHTYRSALRFSGFDTSVPRTASIVGAELHLYLESQTTTGATTRVDVTGLGTQLGTGATWNTYNGTNAWTTPGGDLASSPQPANTTMYPSYMDGWVNFDISRLAETWVRDPSTANKGMLVQAHNEAATNVLTFDGNTWNHGGPTLSIEYELHPGFERDQTYERVGIDDRSALSVNAVSGNVAIDSNDIHLPGVAGMDLDVRRTFNGQNLGNGSTIFGSAWTESINGSAARNGWRWYDNARVIFANSGAIYRFDVDYAADPAGTNPNIAYLTPPGIDADLSVVKSTNVGTLTFRKTGVKWIYSAPYDDTNVRLSQIKDRHGNTISLTYRSDHPGNLDYITDTYGRQLQFTYDFANAGKLTKITDASGRHWDYTTDTTTSSGHRLLTGFTNPEGHTTTYDYDAGALPGTWDKLEKITDARGHDITLGYSGTTGDYSQVTSVTRPVDATSGHDIVWQFNYKPAGGTGDTCTATGVIAKSVETDPEGNLTTYCYNKSGQVLQTFDGNHRSVGSEYTAAANVAKFTELAGTGNPSITTYSFSANGSPQGSSTAVGSSAQTSVIKYCGTALGDTGTACAGTYALDKYLPMTFTDSQGTTQGYAYNSTGDLSGVTTTSGSDHQSFTYTPDDHGNIATSKDGNNNTTTYTWTADFLTKVTPPAPLAAQNFGPDSLGRVKWAQNGNLVFACMTYDGVDRVTRVDWKTGVTGGNCATGTTAKWMTFTYDATGNVIQRQDNSNTTTYSYDHANRRTSETFPSSRTNTYTYDRASNLKTVVDGDGTVSYTYDAANRLKTIVSPKGAGTSTITYDYTDPAPGHPADPSLQTITFPGAITQETKIDAAGNILSVRVLSGSTVLKKRDYTYQHGVGSNSALIQTMSDTSGNITTYTPGAANRLKDVVTTNGASTTETWHYDYDFAGNRTLRKRVVGATTTNTSYGYNAANELCYAVGSTAAGTCAAPPSGATTYSYDGAGQRTTNPTAAFDQLQRMTTLTGTSLGYLSPGNGELVAYGTTNYQSNLLGLSRIIPPAGSATDIIRTPNGAPIAQRTGTSSKQALFTDALGSVLATADDGATSLSRHYSYDPDGNANLSGSGTDSVLRYAGGYQVGSLYHYGARYYDPSTATWTQQDPLNQLASLTEANRYTYVGGDPIDLADPLGLCADPTGALCKLGAAVDSTIGEGVRRGVSCIKGGAFSALVTESAAGAAAGCAAGVATGHSLGGLAFEGAKYGGRKYLCYGAEWDGYC
jgi:RHS repeat-associated protein